MALSEEQQETNIQAGPSINDDRGGGNQEDSRSYRGSQDQNLENINELRQQILELKTRINQLESTPQTTNNNYEWMDGFYDPENAKRIQDKWGN